VTFTIEFMRVRESDNAHATLDRVTNMTSDLDEVKVRAKALFATLGLPQKPMHSGSWMRKGGNSSFGTLAWNIREYQRPREHSPLLRTMKPACCPCGRRATSARSRIRP